MRPPAAYMQPAPNAFADGMRQFLTVAALIAVVSLLAAVHLAAAARPLYVLGAVILAVRAIRKSPWDYLTLSLWFWSISPFVRRVVDYYGGFQGQSLILVTRMCWPC